MIIEARLVSILTAFCQFLFRILVVLTAPSGVCFSSVVCNEGMVFGEGGRVVDIKVIESDTE